MVSESPNNQTILSASSRLKGGSRAEFGLWLILVGQILNLFTFFMEPINNSTLEEYIDHLANLRKLSIIVVIVNITGLAMIVSDVKKLVHELQKDREKWNENLKILAAEINKK